MAAIWQTDEGRYTGEGGGEYLEPSDEGKYNRVRVFPPEILPSSLLILNSQILLTHTIRSLYREGAETLPYQLATRNAKRATQLLSEQSEVRLRSLPRQNILRD